VAGAAVSPAAQALSVATDGSGSVLVQSGGTVTIKAPAGFVTPTVLGVKDATTVGLWPDDAAMPYAWIHAAVFSNGTMRRPREGAMSVELSEDGRNDAYAWPAYEWALESINRAQTRVRFTAGGAGSALRIYTDPNDSIWLQPGYEHAWAVAHATIQDEYMVGGRIVFRFWTDRGNPATSARIRYAMGHELGHIYGLGHPDGGIMGGGDDFSGREREMMSLMFLRPSGLRSPDNATGLAAASSGRHEIVVCVFR
jgi:hypothetical protein